MKNLILPLVTFFLFIACEEENPQPVSQFAGSYSLVSSDPAIEIGFKVSEDGDIHNFGNGSYVKHAAIPGSQQTNNNITTFDKFNGGYGRIEIASRGTSYYRIILIYSRYTDEGLSVYDVQVDIAGEPFFVMPDRIFTRTE